MNVQKKVQTLDTAFSMDIYKVENLNSSPIKHNSLQSNFIQDNTIHLSQIIIWFNLIAIQSNQLIPVVLVQCSESTIIFLLRTTECYRNCFTG